jgi:hypothetical protein
MEVLRFSETSVPIYQWARRNIPEDFNLIQHYSKKLKTLVVGKDNFLDIKSSAAMLMRYALFWGIMQHPVAMLYRRFGTTYWSYRQGSRNPRTLDP